MFYSQFLLSRKGPLGVIWTAAHLESKLKKKHIANTDIAETVDQILHSNVPIALRISSHLLVGVVRIYSRKVDYLFHDCSEALLKIRQAFGTSAINLPPSALVASYDAITLPESFDFDEHGIYVNPEDEGHAGSWAELERHVISRDLITLQETVDDAFTEPNPYSMPGFPDEQLVPSTEAVSETKLLNQLPVYEDILPPLPMEEYMELDYMESEREKIERITEGEQLNAALQLVEDVEISRAPRKVTVTEQEYLTELEEQIIQKEGPEQPEIHVETVEIGSPGTVGVPPVQRMTTPEMDILGSILDGGTPVATGPCPTSKLPRKRKRRPVFDASTTITSMRMRKQLACTRDICRLRWKIPSMKYQVWISHINNPFEQRMIRPAMPDMSGELKTFFNHIISCEAKHIECSSDVMKDQQEILPNDVYSDVEETIGGVCEQVQEIGGFSSVKRRIEFEAIQSIQPRNESFEAVKTHLATDRGEFVEEIEKSGAEEATVLIEPSESPLIEIEAVRIMECEIPSNQFVDLSGKSDLGVLLRTQETANDGGSHGMVEAETEVIGQIVKDKNRWPSRTRAVAGFLKQKFQAVTMGMPTVLNLGEILQGRRRKEAARMFFETLVLTSTGYLQVEQGSCYCDIYLLPTDLLMTTDF